MIDIDKTEETKSVKGIDYYFGWFVMIAFISIIMILAVVGGTFLLHLDMYFQYLPEFKPM